MTKQPCLQAENEQLRTGYAAARLEIESLKERVQQLGKAARDVNSRRVQELEAQLAAVAAPKQWAPEEVADGGRGIRWVTNEGVHGRPTDHDVREYLKRTPTANGCHCDDCKRFYAAASGVTAAPAQAARAGWNACLRNLFSLTDQTGDEAAARETTEFMRGRAFEAKGVARAMNSFGPEHCDDLQAYFTPPAAPADEAIAAGRARLEGKQ